ncbi:MAG TPA: hypothetical protein VJP89_10970 [Pyrinomonadaceae bacterium]|nr:hypothetical protein [Pyrinomonadaceae bacterium]
MINFTSAQPREETPHTVNPTQNLRRRAESVIKNKSIEARTRSVIRYALETNDPWLSEVVRQAEAGESLFDTDFNDDRPTEEKVEVLVEIICRSCSGDDRATRSAALLVLIAAIESSPHPKALAAVAKHLAFTRCSEMNVCGMVDSQIAVFECELFAGRPLTA